MSASRCLICNDVSTALTCGSHIFKPDYNAVLFREEVKKTIESVIMIILGRGGGAAGGDQTLVEFFQCSKPSWLALLSHKTNFVLI